MSYIFFLLGTFTLAINLFRPFGFNVSIPDTCFLLGSGFYILEGVKSRKPISTWMPFHPLLIPSYLILLGGLIASLNAVKFNSSIAVTLKEVYIFSVWMSMGIYFAYKGKTHQVITALICAALFTSALAVFDYVSGLTVSYKFISVVIETDIETLTRYGGTFGHPNSLGMFLGVVIPLILDRLLERPSNNKFKLLRNFVNLSALLLSICALLISGSVTGYVGAMLSSFIVLVVSVMTKRINVSKNILFPVILFSLLTFGLLFTSSLENPVVEKYNKQNTMYRAMEVTGPGRFSLMKEAIDYISVNPIWGAGMDQGGTSGLDESQMVTSFYVHNTILLGWLGGGILVFIGTFAIYFIITRRAIRNIMAFINLKHITPCLLGLSASTIGFFIMDMAQPSIYQRFKWVVAALLLGINITSKHVNERYL